MKNIRLAFLIFIQINSLSLFAQYCIPVVTGPQAGPPDTSGIINVTVNSIINNSASKAGYQNFTALKTIMYKGVPDTIFFTTGESFESSIGWIDYNLDFIFDNVKEEVVNSFATGLNITGGVPTSVPITIPINAQSGNARLRIASNGLPFGFITGVYNCSPIPRGDVEEYTVEIRDTIAVVESGDKFFHGCVVAGDQNKGILGIEVAPTNPVVIETLQSMQFTTTGCTNPATDITTAKLWYTNTISGFVNSATLIGSTANPNGTFNIACNQPMIAGSTNYFWLTYDIANGAILNDSIAARLVQATVSGNSYNPVIYDQPSYRKVGKRRNNKRKEANVWYPNSGGIFGTNVGLGIDFNCDPPCIITDANPDYAYYGAAEGVGSICDANGELLFYAGAGGILYNRAHQMITSGLFSTSAKTSCLFIRKPASTTRYYLFTTSQYNFGNGLYYTEIDLALNNGLGDTVPGTFNTLLGSAPAIWSEAIAATDHCNGRDVWIIVGDTTTSKTAYHAYLITSAGIQPPVISNLPGGPTAPAYNISDHRCHIEISPNGSKIAVGKVIGGSGYLLDFDNSSGSISNPIPLNTSDGQTMSFSADNTKLYFNQYGRPIYQYDLCAANIPASRTLVGNSVAVGWQMQLAPDGKIYIPRQDTTFYTTINKPGLTVPLCDFQQSGFSLEGNWHDDVASFSVGYNESIFNQSILDIGFITDSSFCFGDTLNFTDTTGTLSGCSPKPRTWTWNFGDPASGVANTSANQNPSHIFSSAGTFTVTLIVSQGCQYDTLKKNITINMGPNITLSAQKNVLCNGDNAGSATVNVTTGASPFTYLWNNAQTTSTVTGLIAGNYIVIVADVSGCTSTQTVSITQPAALTATITSTQANCNSNNGLASAQANGGIPSYTYTWNTVPIQSTANASGLGAGTYTLTIKDANGCTKTQTVTITSNNTLTLSTSSTPAGCTVNNGTATANPSLGTNPYTYSWNNGQIAQTATGLASGNYTVIVTDANGCIQTQTVTVTFNNSLSVSTSSTQTGCTVNNGTATANPSNGVSPYTYNWNNGQIMQTATGLAAGNYTVIVTDANGCTQIQTVNVTQTPGPTATASASPLTITIGTNTTLTGTGGGTYQWTPAAGLSCTACANPIATPLQTTTYCVVVTDANGCTSNACVTINVETPCGNIFVPNAFSPNNDGSNELECVLGNCIQTLHFIIYDRWGEKIFETTDQKTCWDGIYKSKLQNTAVFVYYLDATLIDGKQITKQGNISLIR